MKKLMLVIPPIDDAYNEYGKEFDWGWWQPLGLLSIASYLKKYNKGIDIEIMDEQIFSFKEMLQALKRFNPDFLGISANYFTYKNCLSLARTAKAIGAQVIFGGHYVSSRGRQIIKNRPEVDFVVAEDGELAMLEITRGASPVKIPNLVWRKHNKIMENKIIWLKLNELPAIDYSLIDIEKYFIQYQNIQKRLNKEIKFKRPLTVSAQRGCRWREKGRGGCIYCSCISPKWRGRNPELMWNDIMEYKRNYDIDGLVFPEDDFLSSQDWVENFFYSRPKEPRPGIRFIFARPNLTRSKVEIIAKLGCQEVYLGIESGDDDCLKRMNKGINVNSIVKTAKLLFEHGINFIASFVLGAPGENQDSLKKTLCLAEKLIDSGASHFSVYPLVPVPGSKSWQMAIENIPFFKEKFEHEDHIDPSVMLAMWAEFFCKVDLGRILETIDKINNLRNTQRKSMENWLEE